MPRWPAARAVCLQGCDLSNNSTFLGNDALLNNTTGVHNTGIGWQALFHNTGGKGNIAVGNEALFTNTGGENNTAIGIGALFANEASYNIAVGGSALQLNAIGSENTAIGFGALAGNRIGKDNTAIGFEAMSSIVCMGSGNIALGTFAGTDLTTGSNNIDIGNKGVAGESNTIRIGEQKAHTNTYIAGIYHATVAKGVSVIVDSSGHLGTKASSECFKDAIKPMDKASEAILALKPVTFHYKHELDPEGIPQFGLVAEDVAEVNPDLVVRDENGEIYTVRYEAVNAMLLNEFLKEHTKVEQLREDFESKIADQQKQIDALTAGLQKVSAQLEVSKPAR